MPLQPTLPAAVPSHWMPYFQVAGIDQAVEQVSGLGGRVLVSPTAFPGGRFAVVADPHGAAFGLIEAAS
jgi:predicted enzyme related to lactoylglutathione lyase